MSRPDDVTHAAWFNKAAAEARQAFLEKRPPEWKWK